MKTFIGTITRKEYYTYTVDADTQDQAETEMWELYKNEAEPSLDVDNDLTDIGEAKPLEAEICAL